MGSSFDACIQNSGYVSTTKIRTSMYDSPTDASISSLETKVNRLQSQLDEIQLMLNNSEQPPCGCPEIGECNCR